MLLVISGLVQLIGGFSINVFVGCSVARAKATKLCVIRFTHTNWTPFNGPSLTKMIATKLTITAATFTVS